MSYHSPECYYKNCGQCLVNGCICECHKRISVIKEQIANRLMNIPTTATYNHHRGRPRKKENGN